MDMWLPLSVGLSAFAVTGAVTDVASKRIPNRLVLAGLVVALVLRAAWGPQALWQGVAGGLVALAVGFPLFALRAFGAGDVKFLIACGVFVGLPLVGKAALYAAAAGGLLALFVIARRRVPLVAAFRTWELARKILSFGQRGERMTLDEEGAIAAPYGVAIAAGTLMVWFGTAGGWLP